MRTNLIALIAAAAVITGTVAYMMPSESLGRSPSCIGVMKPNAVGIEPCTGPGSHHGFGFNVTYTVAKKAEHDGILHAVVTSPERGVEIWSPIPVLLSMPDGTKFRLVDGSENFKEALRIVK